MVRMARVVGAIIALFILILFAFLISRFLSGEVATHALNTQIEIFSNAIKEGLKEKRTVSVRVVKEAEWVEGPCYIGGKTYALCLRIKGIPLDPEKTCVPEGKVPWEIDTNGAKRPGFYKVETYAGSIEFLNRTESEEICKPD